MKNFGFVLWCFKTKVGFKSEEGYREVLKFTWRKWNNLSGINVVQDVETYQNFPTEISYEKFLDENDY